MQMTVASLGAIRGLSNLAGMGVVAGDTALANAASASVDFPYYSGDGTVSGYNIGRQVDQVRGGSDLGCGPNQVRAGDGNCYEMPTARRYSDEELAAIGAGWCDTRPDAASCKDIVDGPNPPRAAKSIPWGLVIGVSLVVAIVAGGRR